MHDYPPASGEAFGGIVEWLIDARAGRQPDPSLLCRGLPQGPLLSATPRADGLIDFVIEDQREPGRQRTARTTDAASFCALRLLWLPSAQVLISRTDLPPSRERHYLTTFDHITLARIIADAKPGERVKFGDAGHLFLTRSNLCLVPSENRVHKGRKLAISTALANCGDDCKLREALAWLLTEAFAVVDQLPLGRANS
jgi:hypothetical protein